MKKLFVLFVLLAMTLPMWAAPIVAGEEGASEITYGFITDGQNYKDRWTNLVWTTKIAVNDSNYVLFGLTSTTTPALSSFALRVFSGNFIANKLLGFGEGYELKFKFGIDDVLGVNYMPSDYQYENCIPQYDGGPRPTIAALFKTPLGFGINVVADPGMSLAQYEGPRSPTIMVNPYGSVGNFKWSVQYLNPSIATKAAGKVGGDLFLNVPFTDKLSLGFDVEGTYNMDTPDSSIIGAAAIFSFYGNSLDVSTNYSKPGSNNPTGFNLLGFGLEVPIIPNALGASIGADVNLNPNVPQLFRSIDAGIWIKSFAPGKIRLGYLWTQTGNGGGDFYAPASLPTGGVWLKYDISW